MKRLILLVPALILVSGLNAFAADKPVPMDPKMLEMMKKYEAAATPGEPHKVLADIAGNWKTVTQMWESPDSKAKSSKGTSNFKMVLGGRWLQQEFKGNMMGKPYQGMGLIGYDNVKQKYQTNWFDSMSTGSLKSEGDFDVSTKTLKDSGTMSSPVTPSKTQEIRSEWQMVDKKKMIFSMFGKGPVESGPEFKMMEIVYTR